MTKKTTAFDLYDEDSPGDFSVSVKTLIKWLQTLPSDSFVELDINMGISKTRIEIRNIGLVSK